MSTKDKLNLSWLCRAGCHADAQGAACDGSSRKGPCECGCHMRVAAQAEEKQA